MSDPDADGELDRSRLPDGWTVWSQGADGRLVLAYRPDVFNADDFPAACLPTLYLTHGKRTRRPGINPADTADAEDWFVTLYLEPDVSLNETLRFPTRTAALERTVELARTFDDGEIDYRGLYQVPRETYFERLDELTGADGGE
ncbi:DUF5820 family protein [Natrinema salaciae]|uniref:Uncharacterized protein n=1 Tax=Natrinema salaciae TaxID=1186196 RepID=A0A1H9FJG4_9EURY|nr:DUF5820 family protein [Natrinema salaciae]SEQ37488.1 hypothetical protein SAMN04489841_1588 [Natrinema salaciae]